MQFDTKTIIPGRKPACMGSSTGQNGFLLSDYSQWDGEVQTFHFEVRENWHYPLVKPSGK